MKKISLIVVLLNLNYILFAQFSFEQALTVNSLNDVHASNIVDLDLDGDNDILSIEDYGTYGVNRIVWYENLGNGIFDEFKIIKDTAGGYQIDAADIDGDGDLDIVYSGYYLVWMENIGGQFNNEHSISPPPNNAHRTIFSITDMDADGDLDFVASTGNPFDRVVWYENTGGGIFNPQVALSSAPGIKCLDVFDVDGDTIPDIVYGCIHYLNSNDEYAWIKNLGGGSFASSIEIQTSSSSEKEPTSLKGADLNGDGLKDLLATSYQNDRLFWRANLGGGNFGSHQQLLYDIELQVCNAGDVDNDGDFDVITGTNDRGKIYFIENVGGGNFASPILVSYSNYNPTGVFFGDLDSDLDLDIVFSSEDGLQLASFKNTSGNIFEPHHFFTNANYQGSSVIAADIDGDGDMDAISTSQGDNKIAWYENLGNGVFGRQKLISLLAHSVRSVFAADINGDTILDVLSASAEDNKIAWYENLGGGSFGIQQVITDSALGANCVFAADLDGDTDLDVLSTSLNDNKIAWYENLGGGSFGPQQIISTTVNVPTSVYSIDIDGDGDMDVFSSSFYDDKIAWYENLGGGSFGPQQIISSLANGANSVYLEDLDGDSDLDVLSASFIDNKIAWYENLGSNMFGPQQVFPTAIPSPNSVITADIDLDGDMDVISASYNKIGWNENLGNGVFDFQKTVTIPDYSGKFIYASDFDRDGDKDLITAKSSGMISWHKNQVFSKHQIEGYRFIDFNQNGIKDSNDIGTNQFNITAFPNYEYSYMDVSGNYLINFEDTNKTYQIIPQPLQYWGITSDSSVYNVEIDTNIPYYRDSLYFGFYPDTIVDIINAEIIGGFPRCSDTINYWIEVKNVGTSIPSGVIHIQLHDSIIFAGSPIIPDSINGQNVYWHYDSISHFSSYLMDLQVIMPADTIGDTLTSYLNVSVIDSLESTIFLSSDTLNPILVCSYDPNDKISNPIGVDALGYINENTTTIEYTIRFQNTGNDTAITINIIDQLDPNLQWNTMEVLASSDSVVTSLNPFGEITFKFENIFLPDSGVDFLGSQGFVKYKIDLKPNLIPGTTIENNAAIYFDLNPPIITNTTKHTIYDCDGYIPNNLINITLCENEPIIANAWDNLSITSFTWDIPNVYNSSGPSFYWLTDTSGTFLLTLSTTNELCNKDSVFNITIYPTSSSNQNQSICQGDSIQIGGLFQTSAGTYYDSLQTINGCDSVLSITLSVNPVYLSNTNSTICQGDSMLIYGDYQSVAGVYYDSLQTINGCDSVLSTTLTVNPLPNVTLANFNPDTICSSGSAVSLPNGSPSGGVYSGTGVNGGTFDPNIAGLGTHNVIYTYTDVNSCINSDSTFITVEQCIGIDDLANDLGILIYPNPNTGLFTIEKPIELDKEVNISLLDASSRVIINKIIPKGQLKIEMDITNYSKGIYYLQLTIGKEVFVKQILKN
ncbi:MAG TPA: T9SS type A sorting domain-containing protein [Vicingaceae bacterium]